NAFYQLPPKLDVTPAGGITLAGPVGGPFSPASASFVLVNSGQSCPLDWNVTTMAGWLSLAPTNGTLNAGQSTFVTVSITNANNLAPGNYPGFVAFSYSSPGIFGGVSLSVTLNVGVTLRVLRLLPDGRLVMTLQGLSNRVYSIQGSSNLLA